MGDLRTCMCVKSYVPQSTPWYMKLEVLHRITEDTLSQNCKTVLKFFYSI